MRVLIAEDDGRLAPVLEVALAEAGWDVTLVHDGRATLASVDPRDAAWDVIVLDRGLPGLDGLTVCRRLRAAGCTTPVLMLTARGAVRDRIDGLDAGADDYLPKPFDLDELLARLRALHRRGTTGAPALIEVGDLVVDVPARTVRRGSTRIDLSAREFDILALLAVEAGRVVTRFRILDEVWDGETDVRSNVIDVHVGTIRAKIDRPFGTGSITTVRGVGYRIDPPGSRDGS